MENTNLTYYNYTNLRQYYKELGIDVPDQYLRWIKATIDVKIGMFRYDGLPNNLTNDIVEMALMFNQFLCWYNSAKLGGLVLCRYIPNAVYDLYWQPTSVTLQTLSGKTFAHDVPFEDIVLCKDNKMDIIPFITLNGYIKEIVEMENTLHILVKLVRFPSIVTGDKEQVASLKKLLQANADCKGFVIGDKTMVGSLNVQNINLPCTLKEVSEMMDKYLEMATQSIGIYSVEEKRERFLQAELAQKNDYVDFIYNEMVECRQKWIDAIKDKWGISIKMHESYVENRMDEAKLTANAQKLLPENQGAKNNVK